MLLTPTTAALLGSVATAIAIFGGGLAVEAFKRRQDRRGMALALAGSIDALLGLIEARNMTTELREAVIELEAGRTVRFASLVGANAPFEAVTLAYADRFGNLGGDLPFRVARFLTWNQGLLQDLDRLERSGDDAALQVDLIRRMGPLWIEISALGLRLVEDLRDTGGRVRREKRPRT